MSVDIFEGGVLVQLPAPCCADTSMFEGMSRQRYDIGQEIALGRVENPKENVRPLRPRTNTSSSCDRSLPKRCQNAAL